MKFSSWMGLLTFMAFVIGALYIATALSTNEGIAANVYALIVAVWLIFRRGLSDQFLGEGSRIRSYRTRSLIEASFLIPIVWWYGLLAREPYAGLVTEIVFRMCGGVALFILGTVLLAIGGQLAREKEEVAMTVNVEHLV